MRPVHSKIMHTVLAAIVTAGLAAVHLAGGLSWPDLAALAGGRSGRAAAYAPAGGYAVSAAHPLAVEAGMKVLAEGGSAVDAAVVVSYVLAVVEPYASGLGGGGAAMVHPAGAGDPVVYDYREPFPLSGEMPAGYAGVPGFVAGMARMHADFGRLEMGRLIEPALRLAEDGFPANRSLSSRLTENGYRLPVRELPHFYPGGAAVRAGSLVEQKELAATLRLIRDEGAEEAFYRGPIARQIAGRVRGLTAEDFARYTVQKKAPLKARFGGYEVLGAPPPLGGITLLQILQMAEILQLERLDSESAEYTAMLAALIKRGYYDRSRTVGDPEFVYVPARELAGLEHARRMALEVSAGSSGGLPEDYIIEDTPADFEDHDNTTHFVVVDAGGMMVSATNTISQFFGSGIYVGGFFMNNQLTNFSTSPHSPNLPEPGKRPRSYISPTILTRHGRPVLGIGTPGGKKIPMAVSQVLLRLAGQGDPVEAAIAKPRFFLEDKNIVYLEQDIPAGAKELLRGRGFTVIVHEAPIAYGGIYAVYVDYENNRLHAIADPRRTGAARVGGY